MKNQRAFITKRLLKDGLFRLLKTKNLSKITVTELCQEAGINRVTFYNHYSAPQDILVELEANLVAELRKNYSFPLSISASTAYLEDICTHLQEHSDVVKVLIEYNTDTVLTNFMNDISQRFQALKDCLMEMDVDADTARLTATFVGSGVYFLLAQWIREDINKTPAEIAALVFSIINTNH